MSDKLRKFTDKKYSTTSLPMTPVCKRKISQIEHGIVDDSTLLTLNVSQGQVQTTANTTHQALKVENVPENRQMQVSNAVFATFHQGSNDLQSDQVVDNGYSSIEYVSSPVVSIHAEHQAKFSDELITNASNVNFVEITESSAKNSNAHLELYFDVIPTTSNNNDVATSSPYIPRQEHQTPKAQILVRAYSDFLQSQENQQLHSITVESPHPDNDTEYIIPDILNTSLSQLEDVIPQTFIEYKKPIKMESPKKIAAHFQQSKMITGDIDNCKVISSHEMHSEFSNHEGHLSHGNQQDTRHQHYILQPSQQQQRYQILPKYTQTHQKQPSNEYQINTINSKVLSGNTIIMQNDNNEIHQKLGNVRIGKEQTTQYSNDSTGFFSQNSHFNNESGTLFSRSGRLIRRRPEYIEYVNEENMNHELIQESSQAHLPMDMNLHGSLKDKELTEDSDDGDCIGDSLNQADCDSYIDGKKSLPHKKRIPKNYKKNKKCIKSFMCSVCGEQFVNIMQFNEHKVIHVETSTKLFVCEICNDTCDTQLKFFDHLKGHYEPNKIHKCEICFGEFNSAQTLEQHSIIHTPDHLKCITCKNIIWKQCVIEEQMKVDPVENVTITETPTTIVSLYHCSTCSKEFNSQVVFDSHACPGEQTDGSQLHCEDCYRFFKTKAKLLAHRKSEHKEEIHKKKSHKKKPKTTKVPKNGFQCTQCTRTFIHKNSLNYHMRRHTGERPHQCDQCGKAFYAASALKVHKRLHSGEKPYKCEDCGKFFRQWGDLKYHASSVHSETRQFQCEFCGKDFKRKYCLVVHRRIHTGEKKYKCEYCQKLFRASSYLQNHIRVHTGERPYPCPDCGKAFRVRSDMKRHRLTHRRDTLANKNFYPPSKQQHTEETLVNESKVDSAQTQVEQRHTHSNEVQLIQNGEGQLLVAENIHGVLSDQYPIRIMVSEIPTSHSSQPPPAHRQSQVSCVNLNSMTAYTPASPCTTNSNSASSISSEGIIITEGNQQPVNLNMIPRTLTQTSVSAEHTIAGDQYELISTGRATLRPDDSVCVWSGVL